jgi:omega-hydroxy-beta-dihydromenaquinone-9 sulfotransferase
MTKKFIPFYPVFFLAGMAVRNGGISPARLHIFVIYLVRYILLEPFRLLELLIYHKRIRAHRLAYPPVFVLGHWRSGTSHLQNMLRLDPGTVSCTIYTGLFPDIYYLTGTWLKNALNFICRLFRVRYSIQRTAMDLDIPAELDPALCALCSGYSYTWGHLFPSAFENQFRKLVLFEDDTIAQKWMDEYDYLIRKLSYRVKNKRVVVKSPGDTARLEHLIKKYPGAIFIYIHRDPFEVFHSSRYLWRVIQKENSLQKISQTKIDQLILSTYDQLLRSYLAQRAAIPASQLIEVHYEDLRDDPLSTMKRIYSETGLGILPEKAIREFASESKKYKTRSYSSPAALEKEITEKWAFSFKEWAREQELSKNHPRQ